MTVDEYNAFCRSLPHTTHVVQWGGAHVWKVAGKVFAIGGWNEAGAALHVTFKVTPASFEMLGRMPGCRPAPYLASRGMKWIQRTSDASMDDAALGDYLTRSHALVAAGLPKRTQLALGLGTAVRDRASPVSKRRPR
jgi:predicted DNA-binding protein (MmcQ/YjbR family)